MPTNLTAADLAELETRMAALERTILDAPGAAETPTVDAWQAVATTTALLTALREARAERDKALQQCMEANAQLWQEKRKAENERDEARALVEALADVEPVCYHTYLDLWECLACKATAENMRLLLMHAPDCAWDAARKARDAWKGNE